MSGRSRVAAKQPYFFLRLLGFVTLFSPQPVIVVINQFIEVIVPPSGLPLVVESSSMERRTDVKRKGAQEERKKGRGGGAAYSERKPRKRSEMLNCGIKKVR